MAFTATRPSFPDSADAQTNCAATLALPPTSSLGGEKNSRVTAYASQLPLCGRSLSSPVSNEFTAQLLPFESRFFPVNSTSENSEPIKSKRNVNFFSSGISGTTHQRHARNCRLIGFTPLADEDLSSSEESSAQFLGPRKVKAKEVAPCALFYKRADVFVSFEMKSQNVLANSENHYCKIRFSNEASLSELEHAHQRLDHPKEVARPSMNFGDGSPKKSFGEDRSGDNTNLELPRVDREPLCQIPAKCGLTSMPLASGNQPGFQFDCKPFHIFGDEPDSSFTTISRVEHNLPRAGNYSCDMVSDPEQPTSSIGSSGVYSNLSDSIIASSTRAASPVSSIYSSISSTYHFEPLTTYAVQDQLTQSHGKSTNFPLFRFNTERENTKIQPKQWLFDWRQDDGSLADGENESESSSSQLESDDD